MTRFQVRQARIDVPLGSSRAYLFVSPENESWHPWWSVLFRHLLGLAPAELEWRLEPVQVVYVARPTLSVEQRTELAVLLRQAPPTEIAEHRTLRRAVNLPAEQVKQLEVMYFSSKSSE